MNKLYLAGESSLLEMVLSEGTLYIGKLGKKGLAGSARRSAEVKTRFMRDKTRRQKVKHMLLMPSSDERLGCR